MRLLLVGLAAENPAKRKDFMEKLLIVYAFKGKVFFSEVNMHMKIFSKGNIFNIQEINGIYLFI